MSSKKHIVMAKLYEFGGSNTHLKMLIAYFGKENMILVIDGQEQLKWVGNIDPLGGLQIKTATKLRKYAHLVYPSVLSNIKESFFVIKSILVMFLMSIKYGADVTISITEPEKYLYLLWLPFVRVTYILHTTPPEKFTRFTTYTCNKRLGKRKQIVTVSNANKNELCRQWGINLGKQQFVQVVYNCLPKETDGIKPDKQSGDIKNIVTMGHMIDYKNPYLWLDVARQVTQVLPGVRFTWLGNGPLFEYFRNATQDKDRINFVGFTSDTADYLAGATLYYQPSITETHGIGVVEAMYYSLPCVVSNAGGLPESVEDNYNGLLTDPQDVAGNVEAISVLIVDDERLNTFGENSYQKYLGLFTFEKFKLKMDAIYNA